MFEAMWSIQASSCTHLNCCSSHPISGTTQNRHVHVLACLDFSTKAKAVQAHCRACLVAIADATVQTDDLSSGYNLGFYAIWVSRLETVMSCLEHQWSLWLCSLFWHGTT